MNRIPEEFKILKLAKALGPLDEPVDIDPDRLRSIQGEMNLYLLREVGNMVSASDLKYSPSRRRVVGKANYSLGRRPLGLVGMLSYDLEGKQTDPELSTPTADMIKICDHLYAQKGR